MAKKVRYNVETDSYYSCTEPTDLVIGKEYEVIYANDRGQQTDYTLKGVVGHFNSCWFDEISTATYMALATSIPTVGRRCKCTKLEFVNGSPTFTCRRTSTVMEVVEMGNNIYRVTTRNSTYIIQVNHQP